MFFDTLDLGCAHIPLLLWALDVVSVFRSTGAARWGYREPGTTKAQEVDGGSVGDP